MTARPSGGGPASGIAAVVLAAGRSTRAGDLNKLTERVAGKAIVAHVADAVLASRAAPVIVVTGHQADTVRAALEGRDVRFAHNPDFADGISTSISAGIGAVPEDCAGALIVLGDMPELVPGDIDALLAAFDGAHVCIPFAGTRRGNPVLFPRAFFSDLQQLTGDEGARRLIAQHAESVREVPVEGTGTLTDLDTAEAIATWRRGRENG